MGIKERIQQYANIKGISIYQLEKSAGMSKSSWNRTKNLSSESCANLVSIYTDLSAEWLLTGEGSMLKEDKTGVTLLSHSKVPEVLSNQDIILYDINAAANLKTLLGDKTQNILGKISIPDIPKCDGAVYVKGDSMYPLLKSGDIIAYKEVHNFDSVVKGEMYLISFELDGDEYLTVKYVNHSEKEGCIKLVSYNPHHDPMDIPVSSIYAMALVKVSIRMNTMR